MKHIAVVLAGALVLFSGRAVAEPSAALIDGLRQETTQVRRLLREAISFCRDTIYPSTPTRDVMACQDRWEMARQLPTQAVVLRELADLKEKRDIAGLRAVLDLQQGRELAAKAAPLFDDFLTAIEKADRPPPKSKKK